jgi:hypothetical protein
LKSDDIVPEAKMAVDYQTLLDRRLAVAEEITAVIKRLGVLTREDADTVERVRREIRTIGLTSEPFTTRPDVEETISNELGRAGLQVRRVAEPFGPRLTDLVERQNATVRALVDQKQRARG